MIKIAYNKENANLVYEIDRIEREGMTPSGIVEKYVGTVKNTATNTESKNVKVSVIGFDSYWEEVPMNVVNTGTEVNNQNKEVTPSTSVQNVTYDSGYTGLGTVKVNAAAIDAAQTVTLSASESQTIEPSSGKIGLASVTVPAVTAAIDSNIIADNIKKDVAILGVTGTYEGSSPVPEKVALDQEHEYTAIHFITENYSTEINDDMYNKLAEIIGEQAENPFFIKNDNDGELYGIMPHGDSMVAKLTLFRYYGEGVASAIPLNTYTISVNSVDDHYIALITISESLLTDKLITKQGTTCTLDSATETFDIDVLSLIAYAYADEVVTPTNE